MAKGLEKQEDTELEADYGSKKPNKKDLRNAKARRKLERMKSLRDETYIDSEDYWDDLLTDSPANVDDLDKP